MLQTRYQINLINTIWEIKNKNLWTHICTGVKLYATVPVLSHVWGGHEFQNHKFLFSAICNSYLFFFLKRANRCFLYCKNCSNWVVNLHPWYGWTNETILIGQVTDVFRQEMDFVVQGSDMVEQWANLVWHRTEMVDKGPKWLDKGPNGWTRN